MRRMHNINGDVVAHRKSGEGRMEELVGPPSQRPRVDALRSETRCWQGRADGIRCGALFGDGDLMVTMTDVAAREDRDLILL